MSAIHPARLCTLASLALLLACGTSGNGLARETDFPCTLEFASSGIVLAPDPEARWPDPARTIVRDSRGYFYSGTTTPGTLAIWSPDGQFLRPLGRPGEGPGEFTPGMLNLWVTEGDSLVVRDNRFQWSIFTPDHQFVRRFREVGFAGIDRFTHLLDDGRFAGSLISRLGLEPVPAMRIVSRIGQIEGEIGPLDSMSQGPVTRVSSYAGGPTLWLGPPLDRAGPYVLEEWSIQNRLLRRIERTASWYGTPPGDGTSSTPSVRAIYADSLGLLLVLTSSRRPGTRPGTDTLPPERRLYPVQMRLEVIDPDAMEVLASREVQSNEYPTQLFAHGSRIGTRMIEDSTGLQSFEVARWQLVGPSAVCGEQQPAPTGRSTSNPAGTQ